MKLSIIESLKHFNNNTLDYEGVLFVNMFGKYPHHYKLYFDEDGELCYHDCLYSFVDIQKNINKKVDVRKLLSNANLPIHKNKMNLLCCSEYEYLLVGDEKPFLIGVTNTLEAEHISVPFINVFCEQNDIESVMEILKPCLYVSENNIEEYLFGIATCSGGSLYTSWYDFEKQGEIDIDVNYNDDFKEPYGKLRQMIETENKTGLALLYGEPGTGKSSIIKHLICEYPNKDFIFIDDSVLSSSFQDKIMSYFLENNKAVFILEDCEKMLMSRDISNNTLINTILNITDGVMGDVLGIKLICTFNTSLNRIDKALLRKGRMTVKYEFGKLCAEKASKILEKEVTNPMTLAEIYNIDDENDYSKETKRKIGYNN